MPKKKIAPNFEEYFSSVYSGRWAALLEALQAKMTTSVSIVSSSHKGNLGMDPLLEDGGLVVVGGKVEGCYQLDMASVVAALQLPQVPNGKILDLCSAPGGKSLVQVLRNSGEGEYFLNDVSEPRLLRLKTVMKEFSGIYDSGKLNFFKRDASRWGMNEPEAYDSVICDVPCSSEAHGKAKQMGEGSWSMKSVKGLAARQIAILCSGLDALKPGGHLLYSTCSINPAENDQIIEKLHKKRKDQFEIVPAKPYVDTTEITELGQQLFPDASNMGPIYFSLIRKKK